MHVSCLCPFASLPGRSVVFFLALSFVGPAQSGPVALGSIGAILVFLGPQLCGAGPKWAWAWPGLGVFSCSSLSAMVGTEVRVGLWPLKSSRCHFHHESRASRRRFICGPSADYVPWWLLLWVIAAESPAGDNTIVHKKVVLLPSMLLPPMLACLAHLCAAVVREGVPLLFVCACLPTVH